MATAMLARKIFTEKSESRAGGFAPSGGLAAPSGGGAPSGGVPSVMAHLPARG